MNFTAKLNYNEGDTLSVTSRDQTTFHPTPERLPTS